MSGDGGRRLISSGGPWEASVGYSRAVVVGDTCTVAGSTDAGADGHSLHAGDVGGQARAIFAIVAAALAEAGFDVADVVRTRMFVTDIARASEVLAAHGEVFRDVRPAATIVEVRALLDPTLLVEIEVDARRPGEAPPVSGSRALGVRQSRPRPQPAQGGGSGATRPA